MRALRVIHPGLRTTVEDTGRRGTGAWGVPRGGAFDSDALAAANVLVGNDVGAAGLEMTLRAPELEALADLHVAYVGADFPLEIAEGGVARPFETGLTTRLPRGARLCGGYAKRGARGWLAIAGGLDVRSVLGSKATETAGGFGGFEGRPLARGDLLPVGEPLVPPLGARYADPVSIGSEPIALRVLPGPQLTAMPPAFRDAFERVSFAVARDSDRTGVRLNRLSGPELPSGWPREIEPEGAVPGAVQLPPDGAPIVLGVDGPTTGGYAKPAVVIHADLGLLARLAPSMPVRFRFVTRDEAAAASAQIAASLAELRR
jgi:biotin-dependent carboxylase-like uncharacterized protein